MKNDQGLSTARLFAQQMAAKMAINQNALEWALLGLVKPGETIPQTRIDALAKKYNIDPRGWEGEWIDRNFRIKKLPIDHFARDFFFMQSNFFFLGNCPRSDFDINCEYKGPLGVHTMEAYPYFLEVLDCPVLFSPPLSIDTFNDNGPDKAVRKLVFDILNDKLTAGDAVDAYVRPLRQRVEAVEALIERKGDKAFLAVDDKKSIHVLRAFLWLFRFHTVENQQLYFSKLFACDKLPE